MKQQKFPDGKKCAQCGSNKGIAMQVSDDKLLCGPCFRKQGHEGWAKGRKKR